MQRLHSCTIPARYARSPLPKEDKPVQRFGDRIRKVFSEQSPTPVGKTPQARMCEYAGLQKEVDAALLSTVTVGAPASTPFHGPILDPIRGNGAGIFVPVNCHDHSPDARYSTEDTVSALSMGSQIQSGRSHPASTMSWYRMCAIPRKKLSWVSAYNWECCLIALAGA